MGCDHDHRAEPAPPEPFRELARRLDHDHLGGPRHTDMDVYFIPVQGDRRSSGYRALQSHSPEEIITVDHNFDYLLGQTVLVLVDPAANNGHDVASARIVKVYNGGQHVNLRVLYDVAAGDGYVTSIPLFADEDEARTFAPQSPTLNVAYWPHIAPPAELDGDDQADGADTAPGAPAAGDE